MSTSQPTTEELVAKALGAEVIDEDFAIELRVSADLDEALGIFYTYVIEQGEDPETLLRKWNIVIDSTE